MTTDPGDLVLDPTAGSGTTAYVAEQWGRRWITIDTSRVAIALARQRLLTAKYDYYAIRTQVSGIRNQERSPVPGSVTGPPIAFVRLRLQNRPPHHPEIHRAEPGARPDLRPVGAGAGGEAGCAQRGAGGRHTGSTCQAPGEAGGQRAPGGQERDHGGGPAAVAAAERARGRSGKSPSTPTPTGPNRCRAALTDYRQAWRGKMDEVNQTIAASAAQEELVDQPKVTPGVLRVSGPFTVEGVQPAEESLDLDSPIAGEPEALDPLPLSRAGRGGPERTRQRRGVPGQDDPPDAGRRRALPGQQGAQVHPAGAVGA